MQHAHADYVADWKTQVIREGLATRGIDTVVRPIKTSPPKSRRRATLHGKRAKSGATVGFFGGASSTLVQISDCQILDPEILAAIPALEALTVLGASRKGILHFDVVISTNGLDVNVRDGKPLTPEMMTLFAGIAREHRLARVSWDGEFLANRLPPTQKFGDVSVVPPPGAFLQATKDGELSLWDAVHEVIQDQGRVVDLFAGCGTFSLPAAKSSEIWALESAKDLTDALEQGWRNSSGLKALHAECRDLFRRPVLSNEFDGYDAVIIDPPRAGAEAQTQQIASSTVGKVAAVSCNPVTFARDAKILVDAGFSLDWVQPVDQFRWSSHVELAAQFTNLHMAPR